VGAFSAKFSMTLAAKLLMGPENVGWWNDGTDNLYHRVKFGGNRTTHVGVRVQSVMFLPASVLARKRLPAYLYCF